ncbi:hypothetical protein BX589_102202 [Paraburkholderia fungorum]|nr:hypothetical protein BX589_102202 [Paraburkholderia fungorum]
MQNCERVICPINRNQYVIVEISSYRITRDTCMGEMRRNDRQEPNRLKTGMYIECDEPRFEDIWQTVTLGILQFEHRTQSFSLPERTQRRQACRQDEIWKRTVDVDGLSYLGIHSGTELGQVFFAQSLLLVTIRSYLHLTPPTTFPAAKKTIPRVLFLTASPKADCLTILRSLSPYLQST